MWKGKIEQANALAEKMGRLMSPNSCGIRVHMTPGTSGQLFQIYWMQQFF